MSEIDDLREFVLNHFDGSVPRCIELDELLWRVRLAHKHEPQMLHYEAEGCNNSEGCNIINLDDLEIDL